MKDIAADPYAGGDFNPENSGQGRLLSLYNTCLGTTVGLPSVSSGSAGHCICTGHYRALQSAAYVKGNDRDDVCYNAIQYP